MKSFFLTILKEDIKVSKSHWIPAMNRGYLGFLSKSPVYTGSDTNRKLALCIIKKRQNAEKPKLWNFKSFYRFLRKAFLNLVEKNHDTTQNNSLGLFDLVENPRPNALIKCMGIIPCTCIMVVHYARLMFTLIGLFMFLYMVQLKVLLTVLLMVLFIVLFMFHIRFAINITKK